MMKTKLQISRFDKTKDETSSFEEYEVPYAEGMTILDGLRYIQAEIDPSLSFRWECSKGTCGTCGVMLDGKPVIACSKHLAPDETASVSPLTNFPVDKDLTVDLTDALKRLQLTQPFLVRGEQTIQSKAEADASRHLRSCMECWICVSVCPVVNKQPGAIADPAGMVSLARYHLDVRDDLDRPEIANELGIGLYNCEECKICVDVCPKGINIPVDAIQVLLKGTSGNEA